MKTVAEPSARLKVVAIFGAILLTLGLGAVDYVTGREWAISAFYLLPTCLAAWFAGVWAGLAVGLLCSSAWFFADMLNGGAYGHPLIPVWNGLMLYAFFIVVVWLLTEFRRSHYRLEQMVESRTAALRAEVDERKRLEQAKLQAERLAVVGSMAVQVAHEIRNPLGAISLNLDLLAQDLAPAAGGNGSVPDECQSLLQELRAQVLRIHHVLQDYLRFGRMPKSRRTALSLKALLDEKLNFVRPLLEEKHIALRTDLPSNLPPVQADPEQIWEAVSNLIRNAVEAMPGGGNLKVTARVDRNKALVSVTDDGRGMTDEQVHQLFVPFFTTKSNGTGLGLAYSQQVINEHGGRIDFTTKQGEGSTFTIQLPVDNSARA